MYVKITTVVVIYLFVWSSYGGAEEAARGQVVDSVTSSVVMNIDHQEALRRLVRQVKPAAGPEVEISDPKLVPYWKQTVTRKRRRGVSE